MIIIQRHNLNRHINLTMPLHQHNKNITRRIIRRMSNILRSLIIRISTLKNIRRRRINNMNTNLTLTNRHNLKQSISSHTLQFTRMQNTTINRLVVIHRITIRQLLRFTPQNIIRIRIIITIHIISRAISVTMNLRRVLSSQHSIINIIRIRRVHTMIINSNLRFNNRLLNNTIISISGHRSNPLLNRSRNSTLTSTLRATNRSSSLTFRVRVRSISISFIIFISIQTTTPQHYSRPLCERHSTTSDFVSAPRPKTIKTLWQPLAVSIKYAGCSY